MDKLVGLLKNHQVGIWCKRAAWAILAFNFIRLLLQWYNILFSSGSISLALPAVWDNLLQVLLTLASGTLFDFFLLYAAAVAIEHLAGSRE